VIQTLQNSGASALAILQATQNMAYLMQQYQNNASIYKLQDSLAKASAAASAATSQNNSIALQKFYDSLQAARTNATTLASLKHNYSFKVTDLITSKAIAGATVSAFSYVSNSLVTSTTDVNGVATFTAAIFDPASYYYVNNTGYSFASGIIGSNNYTFTSALWNITNVNNTIKGQVVADLDFTNGDAVEGVAGQLISFSLTFGGQINTFPTVTDASGNYSVKVPDAPSGFNYSANISNQITVMQKMYVHYERGVDNPQTTTPYIDSMNTVLQLNGAPYGNFFQSQVDLTNYYSPNNYTVPSAGAFYYSLPADINGNKVISYPSLGSGNFINTNPTGLLGVTTTSALNGLTWIFATTSYAYTPNSTISASLIDLSGTFIQTAPSISAKTGAGLTNNISILSFLNDPTTNKPLTGAFVNLYTATQRNAFMNQFGLRSTGLITNSSFSLGTSIASASIQGGKSYTLNFDYNTRVSTSKNPQ
jgi:hypothetical protein